MRGGGETGCDVGGNATTAIAAFLKFKMQQVKNRDKGSLLIVIIKVD